MTWDEYRDNFDGVPVFFIKKLVAAFGCVIQLHKFVKADVPGCFHSHPAWAIRLVLWGGYVEETGNGHWRTWFPGRIGIVAPDFEHRIGGLRNGRSSWSLWLRGPKIASITVRGCDAPAPVHMMTGMIEIVANAIWQQPLDRLAKADGPKHPYLLAVARAAIHAMKEPDNRMLRAAAKAMSPKYRPTEEFVSNSKKHAIRYRAMIDSALGEPQMPRAGETMAPHSDEQEIDQ